ncbi:MAG: T9SS type A sorting domain-containing protein [Bacteroidales bacterium]|nr:T9SS type A sorting domain-containing protein [Bacteroidales bacterium]
MKKFFYVLSLFFLGFLLNGQQVFAQNPPNPEITVIQPDVSGIEWVFGETYMISWADNFINGVDIILQDYNGNSDITIATNVSGSTYLWTINQAGIVYPGSKFKIRVQSTVNGIYGDVSGSYFKILPYASNAFIKVEQPDVTGINIQIGSDYLISWNHNISGKFTIKLVDNLGDVNHTTNGNNIIASGVEGTTFIWNTTGWPQASLLKVLIESDDYAGLYDKSDRSFRLSTSVGSVEVLRPNKENAVWQVGNEYLISWNDTFTETVDILLMDYTDPLNPVAVGTPLAEDIEGTTWVWNTLGFAASDKYRIRVQSSLDATKYDDSNRDFKLVAHTGAITVEQPNVPNIEWVVGNSYLISWVDNVDAPLDIFLVSDATYDANNSATWTLIEDGIVGSTFVWDIVTANYSVGDDYRILVATADKTIKDVSDNTFKLVDNFGEIHVLQPDVAGIEWVIGNEYLISWMDNVEDPVDIELIGSGTVTIAEDDAGNYGGVWSTGDNFGTGFEPWVITENGTGDAFLGDPTTNGIPLMDNPSFGLLAAGAQIPGDNVKAFRDFTNPMNAEDVFSFDWGIWGYNGYKDFVLYGNNGATELLKFHIEAVTTTKIYVTHDGNTTTVFNNLGNDVMHFSFEYFANGDLHVHANARDNGEADFDHTFSVNHAPDAISFYAEAQFNDPNMLHRVNWFNNLKITKPFTANIATNVVGTTYVWNTTGFSPGTYKIRVYNGSIEDLSDNTFKLVLSQGGSLTVNQPSAGDVWYKGYAYWVIWEDDIMEPLDIYLKSVILGYSAKLKDNFVGSMFDYMVPAGLANSTDYYIEIVSSTDPNLKFQSGLFTITDAIMMAVYPNPSSEYFNLRLDQQMEGMFDVIVYDRFNNRMIQTQVNAATKEHRINTAQLPNGIYFMQVTNGKTTITEKIVVKH